MNLNRVADHHRMPDHTDGIVCQEEKLISRGDVDELEVEKCIDNENLNLDIYIYETIMIDFMTCGHL